MSDASEDVRKILGFVIPEIVNGIHTFSCIGCGIVLLEHSNNPCIHKVNCKWMRAISALSSGLDDGSNEFLQR